MSKPKPLTNKEGEVRQLTAEDFRRMRPATEVLPKMIGAKAAADLLRSRGRPPKENPKAQVTLRLDAEVLKHFKAGGPGWQTRINAALRRAASKAR
ncbi:MAG: BrnA antitoxin family protein [Burkholderiales bacterium]